MRWKHYNFLDKKRISSDSLGEENQEKNGNNVNRSKQERQNLW